MRDLKDTPYLFFDAMVDPTSGKPPSSSAAATVAAVLSDDVKVACHDHGYPGDEVTDTDSGNGKSNSSSDRANYWYTPQGVLCQHRQPTTLNLNNCQQHPQHREEAQWTRQKRELNVVLSRLLTNNLYTLGWIVVLLVVVLVVVQPVHIGEIVRQSMGWLISLSASDQQVPTQQQLRLPDRTIVTLYPPQLPVMAQLPRFFLNYAIATPDNAQARRAVQAVAAQRQLISYAGRHRNNKKQQRIRHVGWDHFDWYQQITAYAGYPTHNRLGVSVMNHVCGGGMSNYQEWYETALRNVNHTLSASSSTLDSLTSSSSSLYWTTVADLLLLACLLRTGQVDGYVSRSLYVHSPIVRDWHGVAAVVVDVDDHDTDSKAVNETNSRRKRRIHSDLILLPILSLDEVQAARAASQKPTPSTQLPSLMADFLLTTLAKQRNEQKQSTQLLDDDGNTKDLRRQWEEFLYQVIVEQEGGSKDSTGSVPPLPLQQQKPRQWLLWTAACHPDSRKRLHREQKQRYIATNCRNGLDPFAVKRSSAATGIPTDATDNETIDHEDQTCCSFFDPGRKPFIPRRSSDDDD